MSNKRPRIESCGTCWRFDWGYDQLRHADDAELRMKAGQTQEQCDECERYCWPDEWRKKSRIQSPIQEGAK